jgi:hypothetical protein
MTRPVGTELSSAQEYRLVDYVERLGRLRDGRRALHLHLSQLKSHNRRDHHLRIAVSTFASHTKSLEGQIFRLANQDVFFIYKNVDPAAIDEAVMRVRYLFSDDSLTRDPERDGVDGFVTWYDVDRDFPTLLETARALYDEVQKRARRLAAIGGDGPTEKPPINPHKLGELIDTIISADLSNLMRRQAVYALLAGQLPQPLFRELFISIAELQKQVLPNFDIVANRWLFQYLTEILDKRMLALLMRNDDPIIASSFSVNLNVSTILSPEFLNFDASLKSGARGTIVLEIQIFDVFSDLGTFNFARDFARERGYRLCLDGLTELTLGHVDRDRLGLDLIKLRWSPSLADDRAPASRQRLKGFVDQTGKSRVIMCHVDCEEAIRFGHSTGIAMYQGRFLDQLVSPRGAPAAQRLR